MIASCLTIEMEQIANYLSQIAKTMKTLRSPPGSLGAYRVFYAQWHRHPTNFCEVEVRSFGAIEWLAEAMVWKRTRPLQRFFMFEELEVANRCSMPMLFSSSHAAL